MPQSETDKTAVCEIAGCGGTAASGHLFCWTHWAQVPAQLRSKIWTAWREIAGAVSHLEETAARKRWQQLAADARHVLAAGKAAP